MIKIKPLKYLTSIIFIGTISWIILNYFILPFMQISYDYKTQLEIGTKLIILIQILATFFTVNVMFIAMAFSYLQNKYYLNIPAIRVILFSKNPTNKTKNVFTPFTNIISFIVNSRLIDDIICMIFLLLLATVFVLCNMITLSIVFTILSLIFYYNAFKACFIYLSTDNYNDLAIKYAFEEMEDYINKSNILYTDISNPNMNFDYNLIEKVQNFFSAANYISFVDFYADFKNFERLFNIIIEKKQLNQLASWMIIHSAINILQKRIEGYYDNNLSKINNMKRNIIKNHLEIEKRLIKKLVFELNKPENKNLKESYQDILDNSII